MNKTLVGIVTFGNLPFTKEAVNSILATSNQCDIFVVIGKPFDIETKIWLDKKGIPYLMHTDNFGFPYSLNDIYDYAWGENDYENLIIMGNDVIVYPYAADSLIAIADQGYEWVCATQLDVRSLVNLFPECSQYFGPVMRPKSFDHKCWEKFTGYGEELDIQPVPLSDIHNFTLYKKSIPEKLGYIDVNFYPAYYSDNDYCRRAVNLGNISSCTAGNAWYFHFWSRTIHQGVGVTNHDHHFRNNQAFYKHKWGGDFGTERYKVPFDGRPVYIGETLVSETSLKIETRDQELAMIKFWKDGNGLVP